jgi:hypothetical protein
VTPKSKSKSYPAIGFLKSLGGKCAEATRRIAAGISVDPQSRSNLAWAGTFLILAAGVPVAGTVYKAPRLETVGLEILADVGFVATLREGLQKAYKAGGSLSPS